MLAFGVLGYLAGPPLLKSVLVNQLSRELNRQVSIGDIAINPYALSAEVSGLAISTADGREIAGFDRLQINLSSASLFKLALVADAIRLDGLRLNVVHQGEGRYDISDLLEKWLAPSDEPSTGLPRFSLNNIELRNARVALDDRPKGMVLAVTDINLGLPFVSSLPYQAEILVEPNFSARFNDSQVALIGRSKPFSGHRESELDLALDNFDLASLQPYLPPGLPVRLLAARLDSDLKIVFREMAEQTFSLGIVGGLKVSGLTLAELGGQPLLAWKELAIDVEEADLIGRRLAVRRVALNGLDASLRVSKQGEFNIFSVIDGLASGQASPAPQPTAESPALTWSLGEFVLSDGLLRWHDESNRVPVVGEVRQLQAQVGPIDSSLRAPIEIAEVAYQVDLGERFRVDRMQVKGMRVDLPAHRIDIAEVANTGASVRLLRNAEGAVEWVSSPILKTIRATDAKVDDNRPWIGKLAKIDVDSLDFRFEDRATGQPAIQELTDLRLRGENLSNEKGSKGRIELASKVNRRGSLKVDGSVQLLPLDLALRVETQAIPLLPLQPYFAGQVDVTLRAGQFSNKGELNLGLDEGGLKAAYRGSATVGNLLAVDKTNKADFLKWKSLHFGAIDFRLAPLAIGIGEIALSDFFARLVLSEEGRLNLQDIVRSKQADEPPVPENAAVPSAATVPVEEAVPSAPPVPIKIAKITLQNGTVNFTDYFVKPNYTVSVNRLGGRVTGLSSVDGSVADLDLRGTYAKTAPVQILGKLNPLAAQSFLDIKATVNGIDLTGFSPYSGKYAGYAIEKGKLSLDVSYKLENKQLTADNKVFIDQFTFGEPVDSPDATKLPVNLAISLLKNNRGEIDINLPISGSLDDPQFSVGGLIVRVIVNLFVKAVTSPFALLGSMFGGGEELSKVEFAPGRARVGEAQGKTLETLAKALGERQALKLEISGLADPEIDREGLKRVAMERLVREERRRALPDSENSGARGELSAEEYKTYLTRVYKAAKFPKPRNMIGLPKDLPVEEMEKLILANTAVGDEDVRSLAKRRAENVQVWLIEEGKVAPERLFLVPPKPGDAAPGARVDFSLR